MIGILVFGIVSYRKLPVSDLPTVDFPTLNVNASLPGASPETMAATVATPLEKAFSAIAGIDEITSNSEPRRHEHHAAVLARPRRRGRGAGRERGDRQDAAVPSVDDPAAELSQAESGGRADPEHRAHVERDADDAGGRVRRDDDRAAACRWSRESRRSACGAPRSTRSESSSTRRSWRRRTSACRRSRRRSATTT